MKWFLTSICCNLTMAFVLGAYFWHCIGMSQGILIGNLYILIKYLDNISNLFQKFTSMYGDILQRKSRVMNAEELSTDFRAQNFTNHVLPKDWQQLSIEGLNFSYHGEEGYLHLEDVSLSFARGERIAFVGESGSGKTTFLKIMRDLYHPRSMSLLADGAELPQGFEGISRAIALVPQNPEIFATTISENITLGAEYDPAFVRRISPIWPALRMLLTPASGARFLDQRERGQPERRTAATPCFGPRIACVPQQGHRPFGRTNK